MPESEPSRGAARAPEPTEGPSLTFDLADQIRQLRQERYWQSGRNSKTVVKYPDFRIVLTALKAHKKIPAHQTDGRLSIQAVAGHVLLRAEGRTFDLIAGRVVAFDREIVHELEAIEESAILQTIAWPTRNEAAEIDPPL